MRLNQYGSVCLMCVSLLFKTCCYCYIVILIQLSQVYINNRATVCISNNGLIVISYIIKSQHLPQTMIITDSRSKKNIYFSFGQILDIASLAKVKSNKKCIYFQMYHQYQIKHLVLSHSNNLGIHRCQPQIIQKHLVYQLSNTSTLQTGQTSNIKVGMQLDVMNSLNIVSSIGDR